MKTQYLHLLAQNLFAEKRLAHMSPPGSPEAGPAPLPEGATQSTNPEEADHTPLPETATPVDGPEAATQSTNPEPGPTAPEKSPDELKTELKAKITELQGKVREVTGDTTEKYTKGMMDGAKAIEQKLTELDGSLDAIDVATATAKADLEEFSKSLNAITNPDATTLDANEAAKTKIKEKQAEIDAKKAEVRAEAVQAKVMEQIGAENPDIKAALEALFNAPEFQAKIDADIAAQQAKVDEADGLTTPAEIDAKLTEVDLTGINVDKYTEGFTDFVTKKKPIVDAAKKLEKVGGTGEKCQKAKDEMNKSVAELIKQDDITPEIIAEEYTEAILMAHVSDVIQEDPETIKKALRYYELGKYQNATEDAASKQVLDKIMTAKKEGKLPEVNISFMGGTDATEHRLMKSESYHQDKATTFDKMIGFMNAGKLNINGTLNRALIEQYIAASGPNERYNLVNANQANRDEFLKGGGLMDAALSFQRAEDMKKRIYGEQATLNADSDEISLERGATNDEKLERKSGLKFAPVLAEDVVPVPTEGEGTEPAPEPAPEPTPEPTPEPAPAPTPAPTPEPTPAPLPGETTGTGEVEPAPTPTPLPSEPTETGEVEPAPTPTPLPSEPTETEAPTVTPLTPDGEAEQPSESSTEGGMTVEPTPPVVDENDGLKYADAELVKEIQAKFPKVYSEMPTAQDIEKATFEVFNSEAYGTNLAEAKSNPDFRSSVLEATIQNQNKNYLPNYVFDPTAPTLAPTPEPTPLPSETTGTEAPAVTPLTPLTPVEAPAPATETAAPATITRTPEEIAEAAEAVVNNKPYLTSTEFTRFFEDVIKKVEPSQWNVSKGVEGNIFVDKGTNGNHDFQPVDGFEYVDTTNGNAVTLPTDPTRRETWLKLIAQYKKDNGLN